MKELSKRIYDIVIIGGGPGGYTAALYGARAGFDTLVIERISAGGQLALTHWIDNYPGYEEGIDGYTLADKMKRQAERFGAESVFTEVIRVNLEAVPKVIETAKGVFYARTVILATGANPRTLGLKEEETLVGRGVAYCASCDGMFYRGKTVAVIGGGNTAVEDALLLSRLAKKVILIHRRDSLSATKIYHQPLLETPNIEFRWNSVVTEFLHEEKLTGLQIHNVATGEYENIEADGVFVSIGRKPASELYHGQIKLDENGYVIAGEDTKTNISGVFAIGDLRTKKLRQVVTAVADGALAVSGVQEYLAE